MAVKASAIITLTSVVDIKATYRYYCLQSSTASKPAKPTTNPPSSTWDDVEPTYTSGSTNSLYFVDLTEFSNGTFAYSEVSLSTAYEAAKEAYNKAQNAQNSANNAQSDIDNLEIGGRNVLRYSDVSKYFDHWGTWNSATIDIVNDYMKVIPSTSSTSCGAYAEKISKLESGTEYTLSFEAYADANISLNYCYIMCDAGNGSLGVTIPIKTTAGKYTHTFTTVTAYDGCSIMLGYSNSNGCSTSFYIRNLKVEKGNRATDWTLAPEDLNESVSDVETAVKDNATRINNAQLALDSINAMISSLVTGQNGESLMTQTDSGWTFSMATILDNMSTVANSVNSLSDDVTASAIDISAIKERVDYLGEYRTYINFDTTGAQPVIILGAEGSPFKVLITNTGISFMEGKDEPAYITNKALNITDAVITGELRHGNFAWETRSNGNYGLVLKG